MPLHPQARTVLDQIASAGVPPFEQMSPQMAREMFRHGAFLDGEPEPVARVRDFSVPGPAGTIPVRLYEPLAAQVPAGRADKGLPALVYFHGGGFVIGDIQTHDTLCRRLANASAFAVASVDYRLAPEHKFPAAVLDCEAATRHLAQEAGALGLDPDRIAVGGDSAGGNLAAVTAILARDHGGPKLVAQVLIYPATGPGPARTGEETGSRRDNGQGYLLTTETMRWFIGHYTDPKDAGDPRAAPILTPDLRGLPSAVILTAEFDPLRDEGEHYAERLREAGVPVILRRYDGMFHGFMQMAGGLDMARQAAAELGADLRRLLPE